MSMFKAAKSALVNYLQRYRSSTSPQAKLWTDQHYPQDGIHKILASYARAAKLPNDAPVHAHTLANLLGHNA